MSVETCWVCGDEIGPENEGTIGGDGYQMCLVCDEELEEEVKA